MSSFVGPIAVTFANIFYPLRLADDRVLYRIEVEGGQRYYANAMPVMRDDQRRPLVLQEEIARGSVVRLAIGDDGLLRAIQVMIATYDDPFCGA